MTATVAGTSVCPSPTRTPAKPVTISAAEVVSSAVPFACRDAIFRSVTRRPTSRSARIAKFSPLSPPSPPVNATTQTSAGPLPCASAGARIQQRARWRGRAPHAADLEDTASPPPANSARWGRFSSRSLFQAMKLPIFLDPSARRA
jgi:hypothetical protein